MGAKKNKKSKKAQQQQKTQSDQNDPGPTTVKGEDLMHVCPSRVRFQHSKIRPYFSGCGRSVTETLDEIKRGDLEPGDLPPIQVLIGPDDESDGLPWYFSLNNRRLWVLKQCHKEGLLDNDKYNNKIPVRVRMPKSEAEAERYSVDNCALEAKFMREANNNGGGKSKKKKGKGKKGAAVQSEKGSDSDCGKELDRDAGRELEIDNDMDNRICEDKEDKSLKKGNNYDIFNGEDSSDSESESDDDIAAKYPFSALL
eukprot:CAMPEP_0183750976 /NCGR_PEP_ID=MMETSP0739-20130205/1464_1 /TAXON_ID=385413 /ORGANISM="Thalassiosira miniscula, Strain CCMP1093" /LENGTH=254 /DNA_ID=CAMNT_0025987145 /DNA_START=79 /DNA_END=843 /DNA_ORIENTATION=+